MTIIFQSASKHPEDMMSVSVQQDAPSVQSRTVSTTQYRKYNHKYNHAPKVQPCFVQHPRTIEKIPTFRVIYEGINYATVFQSTIFRDVIIWVRGNILDLHYCRCRGPKYFGDGFFYVLIVIMIMMMMMHITVKH